MVEAGANAWLVNTGWTGGGFGEGARIKLRYTRAIIDAIHHGDFDNVEWNTFDSFNLQVPASCPNVPAEILMPQHTWKDQAAFDETLEKLVVLFQQNFQQFEAMTNESIVAAGPALSTTA
jgi:phosphoenolpyruvate carboxykinase (ATP)